MTFKADASGAERVGASMRDAAAALLDLDQANEDAANDVLGFVRPPVRTGALANTVRDDADALGFTLTAGGPGAPYAPYAHARDPFLARALDDQAQAVTERYVDHAREAVDLIKGD